MINWGISSQRIFKNPPQNIKFNANEENEAENTLNPPKFESNMWSNSTFPELKNIIMAAILEYLLNHSWNLGFCVTSDDNIIKADKAFTAKGTVTNITLYNNKYKKLFRKN